VLFPRRDVEGSGLGSVERATLDQIVRDARATNGIGAESIVNIALGRVDQPNSVAVIKDDARVVLG
jgi:hypothetical protein